MDPLKTPLRILHLEDNFADAELVRSTLAEGGIVCSITLVIGRAEFISALEHGDVDLVLSESVLPGFSGMEALEIVRDKCPDVPFVLVYRMVGDEMGSELMQAGAVYHVAKDRISGLVPSVHRAMRDAEQRVEYRRLEEQVIHSQKMEIFGQLAAGVAHDFNNILAVILGYGELMLHELSSNSRLRQYIEPIRDAAQRGSGLTRQLLVFSRKQTTQPVVLDLNTVLTSMDNLLRRLIDENIELTIVPGQHIGRVKVDAGHVWQVLMNMVVNARDAMPNGGKLTIATRNVKVDPNYVHVDDSTTPGNYVMLSVSDTGTGMTDAVKARLFEPFFTTKPTGKGTGLGLITCQTIAKQYGGHIDVYSEPDKGTTFKVYFPRIDQPLDISGELLSTRPLPRGTETLLLVEDDPSVRNLAQTVLETQGYKVLSASNGEDALKVVRDRQGPPIRLVITDVIMPRMDGKPMADRLTAMYPDIKVLFTSGYTDDTIAQHGVLDAGIEFLPKPYTPATLIRRVSALLDTEITDLTSPRAES